MLGLLPSQDSSVDDLLTSLEAANRWLVMVNNGGQPLKHAKWVQNLLVVHCSWLKVGCCVTNCVMLVIALFKIVLRLVSIFNDSAWLVTTLVI